MGIIQIAMIGIGAVALALMVKQQKSEYALYLSLSAVVLILVFSMNRLQVVMETIRKIEQYTGIDVAMLKILVKLMGITYVAEFASGICKDAGFFSNWKPDRDVCKVFNHGGQCTGASDIAGNNRRTAEYLEVNRMQPPAGRTLPVDNGFAPTETECRFAEMLGFA